MPVKKKSKKNPLTVVYASAVIVVAVIVVSVTFYQYFFDRYDGSPKWLHIPAGSSETSVRDSLVAVDPVFGSKVYRIWSMSGGNPSLARGAYRVDDGMSAVGLTRKIAKGRQTPVKVVFNNIRTMEQLAGCIAAKMEFTADEFLSACDRVLPESGFEKETYPAAFIPDSYEFYWTASPDKVVDTLLGYRNRYWNEERRSKASRLGLNPVAVATVASIVEEETGKSDERPLVARLYLNRIRRNMPLQADPTVKFAVGDFGLKRILRRHLDVESSYNTYKHNGLPPGPIRIAERSTLEQVLDAPVHNYIYMCAKEDFSGRHNFAVDFSTHQQNARRYQAELNRRGIK